MIKRTLCFSNPAYLSLKNAQLVIRLPNAEMSEDTEHVRTEAVRTIPIEDVGFVVLDNNCALITCYSSHLPVGLLLPLCGNTLQN